MSQREGESSGGHWTLSCKQRPTPQGSKQCTARQVTTEACKDHMVAVWRAGGEKAGGQLLSWVPGAHITVGRLLYS